MYRGQAPTLLLRELEQQLERHMAEDQVFRALRARPQPGTDWQQPTAPASRTAPKTTLELSPLLRPIARSWMRVARLGRAAHQTTTEKLRKNPTRKRFRTVPLALALAVGLIAPAVTAPEPALAAEVFIVNTTADSNGSCDPAPGDCSLREAINASNANGNQGSDDILFEIPGQGVQTIRPTSPLPQITGRVVIDGYSQPGSESNDAEEGTDAAPLIELDGSAAGDVSGLVVSPGGGATIMGLVINRFRVAGVQATDRAVVSLGGNFIGANAAGTEARPNGVAGVIVESDASVIGGDAPFRRNLISGNGSGVTIGGKVEVLNNLIGTDRTGKRALGNERFGVLLRGTGATVERNTIAFNDGPGVVVPALPTSPPFPFNNRITRNAIFANDGLGIDLNDDGPTANDQEDVDLGPNALENFPKLTSATTTQAKKGKKGKKANKKATTTIVGTLHGARNREFIIELFSSPANGDVEGKTFLTVEQVSTDDAGNADFTVTVNRGLKGQAITATAPRESTSNTSELSPAVKVEQIKAKKDKKDKKGKKGKRGKRGR